MDEKELLIISMLRKNARDSITNIAKKTGIPASTVFDKIRKCEKNAIKKHTSLVDFQKLGYSCWAKIILKVAKEDRERLKAFALENKNVNSLFEINQDYDFIIETVHKNSNELKLFLESLEGFKIKEKQVHTITGELKREAFLT
jgi:DNA-binding Lrp family transcriptional regulator